MAIQWVVCFAVAEVYFWTVHYALHRWRRAYQYVHAQHHEGQRPIAMVGLYASVWEMVLLNAPLCSLAPTLVLALHPVPHACWNAAVAAYVCFNHCRHHVLPRMVLDAAYHPEHHRSPHHHFGSQRLDSWLLGTVAPRLRLRLGLRQV